jgi:signal transduction histidine kinase/CheY-like chemotaxis protein
MVICIEEDNNDHLWLGTNNGISSFNIKNSSSSNYTTYNGLASNISEPAASHTFNSGDLLFGGFNGFNIFKPSKFEDKKYDLSPTISSVQLDDTIIYIGKHHKKPIAVNHKNQSIRFNFSLPDYKNPSMHNYFVMLEGADNKWHNIGSQNMISYSNLDPKHYIFKIKAKNEANITSNITTLKFEVEKAFYQSPAFKTIIIILIILIFAFLIYVIKKRQEKLKKVISERTQKLETAYKELLNKNTYIRQQNRQIERHHNELEQKVAERTHDLEIAKQRAEESDRLKSAFLANMSHEIRTPLNAITGFSTLVSNESADTERKQKYVNIIKFNTASLLKLVEDILDISKIEANQLKIEKELFEINTVIIDINTLFQKEIVAKKGNNVKLLLNKTSPPNSNIFFYSDPVRIKQIIENLLSNAIKFTHRGKIELGYKVKDKSILFWVSDTGIGIKPDDLEYIFNRFTKVESDDAIYRGTGLGLSISRSLVEMLNGHIWVESKIDKGSTFYFELPGNIDIKNQSREKRSTNSYNIDLSDKNILIVEDERSNYILVQSFLTKTRAMLTWAHNGNIAIEHCKNKKYDIILMDIRMPVIDGYETLRQIRKIDAEVPIIAQTAYATPDEKEKISQAGFNDYIVKPYSKDDILKKIAPYVK